MRQSALVFTLGLLAACGSRTSINAQICEEGRQLACACADNSVAIQVCLPGGVWSVCECPVSVRPSGGTPGSVGPGTGGSQGSARAGGAVGSGGRGGSGGSVATGGRTGGSGGRGGSGGSAGNSDAAANSGAEIARGTSQLIDVFVGDPGIYVVTTDAVALFDRTGVEKKRVAGARQNSTAAFDGTQLVVADRAKLTTYDLDLVSLASADLMEACTSSVLVSRNRFVCGPSNDWDRIYYTYDTKTGKLLASSNKYTYNGIPMRRVPGTDDFVTVTTNMSPSDFHLYTVLGNGEASYINESPYHGDFTVNATYAFDGAPAKHLITSAGLLLQLYGTDCSTDANSFTSGCFVKDGALGTLTGSQYFVAMDSDATGTVFGLVDPGASTFSSDRCTSGCLLQRIDVASRTIVSQSIVQAKAASIVAFRNDPIAKAAVVGYVVGTGSYYSSSDPYPGYRVVVMPY